MQVSKRSTEAVEGTREDIFINVLAQNVSFCACARVWLHARLFRHLNAWIKEGTTVLPLKHTGCRILNTICKLFLIDLNKHILFIPPNNWRFQVVLETEITNQAALNLYQQLGFVRDKRLLKYYLNGVDAFRLKLWLKWRNAICLNLSANCRPSTCLVRKVESGQRARYCCHLKEFTKYLNPQFLFVQRDSCATYQTKVSRSVLTYCNVTYLVILGDL